MVICLERGADLHMAQLMPLPLTVSCFSKIQIGFTFLLPAHPGKPEERAVKLVCVCVSLDYLMYNYSAFTAFCCVIATFHLKCESSVTNSCECVFSEFISLLQVIVYLW